MRGGGSGADKRDKVDLEGSRAVAEGVVVEGSLVVAQDTKVGLVIIQIHVTGLCSFGLAPTATDGSRLSGQGLGTFGGRLLCLFFLVIFLFRRGSPDNVFKLSGRDPGYPIISCGRLST